VGGEYAVSHLIGIGFFAVVIEEGTAAAEFFGDGLCGEAVAE
jgi:hypothetical protein